jgi:hypothetical protein
MEAWWPMTDLGIMALGIMALGVTALGVTALVMTTVVNLMAPARKLPDPMIILIQPLKRLSPRQPR